MATLGLSKVFILDKYFAELQKFWETERKLQGDSRSTHYQRRAIGGGFQEPDHVLRGAWSSQPLSLRTRVYSLRFVFSFLTPLMSRKTRHSQPPRKRSLDQSTADGRPARKGRRCDERHSAPAARGGGGGSSPPGAA
ncbi:hypothetical protein IscW_ISCW009515, partial [Ixodes scapularis]